MKQIDELNKKIESWIDLVNRFEIPKGMRKVDYRDGRDHARGVFDAFCFVQAQIKSIANKAKRK